MALESALREQFGPFKWASNHKELVFKCPECQKLGKFYVNLRTGRGYCHFCHFTYSARKSLEFNPVLDGRMSSPRDTGPSKARSWVGVPTEAIPLYGDTPDLFEHEAKRARSYFERRGFGPGDALTYGVHFCPTGYYEGRIVFPVPYEGTAYTFIARDYWDRSKSAAEKVKHPPKSVYDKEDLCMMGFDLTYGSGSRVVVLVEGPFDVMAVGSPPGVALHGTHLSTRRRARLLQAFDRFVLLLDNDTAGVAGKEELKHRISLAGKTVVCPDMPPGDPAEIGRDKCREILEPFLC